MRKYKKVLYVEKNLCHTTPVNVQQKISLAAWPLAAALWAFLAYADLHSDDSGIIAGFILIAALLLGTLSPARPWLWGILTGASIPLTELCILLYATPNPHLGGAKGLLLLLAFTTTVSMAGSYIGAFAARFVWRRLQLS